MDMKKKFKIITIGCKTNQYESQAFSDQLKQLGLVPLLNSYEGADICIVNTCSVTKNADKKSLSAIKFLKKKNPKARFFITGCMCKKVLENLEKDIIVVSNANKRNLISKIFPKRVIPKFNIKNFDNHTRAFVKIQDGCNSGCSYCVIPYTRGRSRSRKLLEILCEISKLIDSGYKEIVLTGINIAEYKSDVSFEELLKRIERLEGLERIKISSIDPIGITDDLISILKESKKIVSSLHLVLQSGSDRILKKMNRKYTIEKYLENEKRLLALDSDFTFTTDIIVGFPSETDEDFEKTLQIVKEVKFSKVHIFPYSKRPNTVAATYKEHLNSEIIERRKNILKKVVSEAAFEKGLEFIGRKMKVLLEKEKGGYFFGHTQNNLLVCLSKSNIAKSNDIVDVKLIENKNDYILGELCI
jgi:threonylcarbamoyladenosine tRNA methylthiotransferase MtaB